MRRPTTNDCGRTRSAARAKKMARTAGRTVAEEDCVEEPTALDRLSAEIGVLDEPQSDNADQHGNHARK